MQPIFLLICNNYPRALQAFVYAAQSTLNLDNLTDSFGSLLFIFFLTKTCDTHLEYKVTDPGATHQRLYHCISTGLFYFQI